MGTFTTNVGAWRDRTKVRLDDGVRAIAIEILTRIVLRSPVGNPELWAANAHAAGVNNDIKRWNVRLRDNPNNRDSRGRLKRGLRSKGIQGGRSVGLLNLPAGQGYVGGRFRNNWFTSIGEPDPTTTEEVDGSGTRSIARGVAVIGSAGGGVTKIFIANSLPYAIPLEYGHSKQAPNGMVRLTCAEFPQIVRQITQGDGS